MSGIRFGEARFTLQE